MLYFLPNTEIFDCYPKYLEFYLPREQEAACAGAGGGAGLATAGCPALELAGDLTHDGPGHEQMPLLRICLRTHLSFC